MAADDFETSLKYDVLKARLQLANTLITLTNKKITNEEIRHQILEIRKRLVNNELRNSNHG